MENIQYYFGIRVSEFRRLNGLTQKELAEKIGMTTSLGKLEETHSEVYNRLFHCSTKPNARYDG